MNRDYNKCLLMSLKPVDSYLNKHFLSQGKLESHSEYERITKLVEEDISNQSDNLTKAFIEERSRLLEQKSSEVNYFR